MKSKTVSKEAPLPAQLGPYIILEQLGKGGMGEVFLAYDPTCGRKVALKRILPELLKYQIIRDRFLKEAKIAASLYHPSIIPIHSIHSSEEALYYVMPYVAGVTLKKILRETREKEKEGEAPPPLGGSMRGLMRIFLNLCQAVSYCHSCGILHRDLKPENILIGNFGQVLLLDWGLAAKMGEQDPPTTELPPDDHIPSHLTKPGKVLGTLSYMPPERVDGRPADISSEIYSLGVILYQLLTLHMPFHRTTIQEYKKHQKHEKLLDALEVAPYRDISPELSDIAKKCLAPDPADRFSSVDALIKDLESFTEGLPDWVFTQELSIEVKEDWEMQENVLLSKLIAITRSTEIMEWVILMISKATFSGNKRLEAAVTLKKGSHGVGFLINIPGAKERASLEDGYSVWLGSKKQPGIKLFRSNVAILELLDKCLIEENSYKIAIEIIDHHIRLFLDGLLLFDYVDHIPLVGLQVGLLLRDMEFSLSPIKVYIGSQSEMVNCLSVPDAFLAAKNFDAALNEYERIANSFTGRIQGREALFRKGISLIEKAKEEHNSFLQKQYLDNALLTFEKLHQTVDAPLEYLGKSLVYQKLGDIEEEIKCLELCFLRYPKHPSLHLLEERVVFRLHESAKQDRIAVYYFAYLTLRYLSHMLSKRDTHALIHNLSTHFEHLYFVEKPEKFSDLQHMYDHMAMQIAFWLNRAPSLHDMLEGPYNSNFKENIRFILLTLGHSASCPAPLPELLATLPTIAYQRDLRPIIYQIEMKLMRRDLTDLFPIFERLERTTMPESLRQRIDLLHIWALLLKKERHKAKALLDGYSKEQEKSHSPFFLMQGCLLAHQQGYQTAIKHFNQTTSFAFPPLAALLGHYLKGSIPLDGSWMQNSFLFERIELYKQLVLFYLCLGKKAKALYFERKLKKTVASSRV